MNGLKILITNIMLANRTGTEVYVRDLATALLKRGARPIVYTRQLGLIARELQAAQIPVIDRLTRLAERPDLIHGHHNLPTAEALLHFRDVPAIFCCHDAWAWHDRPPSSSRIVRYVAVDLPCRDRLILTCGIPEERVRVIYNFVDLERFRPRDPLPERPKRALVFSNYATRRTHLPAVRKACAQLGLTLEVIGAGVGNPIDRPEEVLGAYDLVFAKGRCALEALAVGVAVILCDTRGVGPMVTTDALNRLRPLNFGYRAFTDPVTEDCLVREIGRYDPQDAALVCYWIRANAGLNTAVEALTRLYGEVLAEHAVRTGQDSLNVDHIGARLDLLRWRLHGGYGRLKQRFVWPISRRVRRLLMLAH